MSDERIPLVGNGLPTLYLDLSMCYETKPCQHRVTDESGKTRLMFAGRILDLYKERGMVPDPHFSDHDDVDQDDEDVELNDGEVAALLGQDGNENASCDCCCSNGD